MNKYKIYNKVKQDFMLKRVRAQEECENFIENLRQNPQFNKLYTDYTKKELEYLKTKYEDENIALKHEAEDLKNKIEKYLSTINVDKSKLYPHYECPICNDTGVVGGKICKCFLKELNSALTKDFNNQATFSSFKNCNTKIMNENDKKTLDFLKTWCEKYPNTTKININIIGGSGSGKTFLLECVANEMINQNFTVCYKTAFELNELARQYHMGKSYTFADCLDADILLIDDLGTEPVLKNITKEYLYNLINTRQVNNRPTFISTNLSLENILSRYDERIFSRLGNKNLSINIKLDSKDKRLL